MHRLSFIVCTLFALALTTECQAQVNWEYASTVGTTIVTEPFTAYSIGYVATSGVSGAVAVVAPQARPGSSGRVVPNPEPSTFVSFGLLGLFSFVRRKRKKSCDLP